MTKLVSLPINSVFGVSLYSKITKYTSSIDCFESFELFLTNQFFDKTLLLDKRLWAKTVPQ